jgi:serine/threonine protein kinase
VSATVAPGAELAPGYTVVGLLNRGPEVDVYDVLSQERACRCIAKTPRTDVVLPRHALTRLRREGRLLRRFTHPHLVRAYEEARTPDGRPAVILETLGGATLSWLVRDAGVRLMTDEIAQLGLQLASALHYLHGHGWLHLDLKPSNVIAQDGIAKLLDLNLAQKPGRVRAGYGSPQYRSPEQARGGAAGEPADVWGLGATLWAAAAGRRPFGAFGEDQLRRRAEPLGRVRRLPRALTRTIDACLEPEPGDRPALAEVRAVLEPLAG